MALVAVVCAVAGGLALLAAGRPWLRVAAPRRPPLPDVALTLTGRDLEPLVPALGVVGLAGVVGLLATRRWGRVVVGALLAVSGLAIAVRSLVHLGAPGADQVRTLLADAGRAGDTTNAALGASAVPAWPALAAVAGLLLALGGVAVVLRSRSWPTMSARYERAAPQRAKPTDAALWDALDAGTDPTAPDPPPARPDTARPDIGTDLSGANSLPEDRSTGRPGGS